MVERCANHYGRRGEYILLDWKNPDPENTTIEQPVGINFSRGTVFTGAGGASWQCSNVKVGIEGRCHHAIVIQMMAELTLTHLRCAISFIDRSPGQSHFQFIMSATEEEELQALYDSLRQIRLVNYVTISCVALLVHDILTNLDREIPLIWRYYHNTNYEEHTSWRGRARRTLVQALFIFGRYYALFYLVGYFAVNNHQGFSVPFCKVYYYYLTFGGEILYSALVNVILVIRLNAMYQIFHGKEGLRKHQIFLASVVIIESLAEIIVCIISVSWIQKRVVEPPAGIPWPGCMLSEDPNVALTLPAWIISIIVATIFLGLTLHLLYSSMKWRFKHFRDITISNIKEEIQNIQPMTRTLVRDSVLFYFPMFGILVASVPVTAIYRTALATVTAPIILALYSFCASRLIIHTRECFTQSSHDAPSREVEAINFAPRSLMTSHTKTDV